MVKIFVFVALFLLLFAHPVVQVSAQGVCSDPGCGHCGTNGVWTAFGCMSTDPSGFVTTLLTVGVGVGGGIAFLLILIGGFQILTSAGNPEKLTAGRELVTSAIAGLLLIVFSIFLLKFIGYDILRIPGFG